MPGGPIKISIAIAIIAVVVMLAGIAYLSTQISGLNQKLVEMNQTLNQVSSNQEATSQAISNVNQKLNDLNETITSNSQKIEQASGAIQSLNQSLSELRQSLETLNNTVSGLSTQLQEISQTVSSLTGFPRMVTDDLGRTVIIPNTPQRIISLAPSVTEMIYAIGAQDLLVGVDDYSNYPPNLLDAIDSGQIQRVGGFTNPNIELILSLQPDVIFTTTGVQEQIVYQLEERGLTVVALGDQDVYQVIASIVKLGYVLGMEDYATQVAAKVSNDIASLASITANTTERPSVAIIVWNNPIFVVGGESFLDDIIYIAGGVNAFTNYTQGYPMISPEELVDAAPDIIVFTDGSGVADTEDALSWLQSLPGGNTIPAVQNGQVYVVHGEYSNSIVRPGIRTPAAGIILYAIIHGDAPNDLTTNNFDVVNYADQLAAEFNVSFNLVLVRGILG